MKGLKTMEKFSWDVNQHPGTHKFEVSIEQRKYIVDKETAAIFHALMCINDSLEEICRELPRICRALNEEKK
jgi:hypothetical protein